MATSDERRERLGHGPRAEAASHAPPELDEPPPRGVAPRGDLAAHFDFVHARCGLEDNIYLSKRVLAKGCYELVAKVADLAREAERPVATPAQARELLRVRARA